jgi:hypothetical protein
MRCIFYFADQSVRKRVVGAIAREQAVWAKNFYNRFGYQFLLMNDGMKVHESRGALDLFEYVDDFIYDMHISEALQAFQAKFDATLYQEYYRARRAVLKDQTLDAQELSRRLESLDTDYMLKMSIPDDRQDFTVLYGHLQHLRVRHRIMRTIEKFDKRVRDVLVNSIAVVFTKVRPKKYDEKIIGEAVKTTSPYYGNAAMRKTIDSLAGETVYPRHIIFMNIMNMAAGKGIGGSLSHEIAHLISDDIDNLPPPGEDKTILVYRNVLKRTPDVPILTKEMQANLAQAYFVGL